MFNETHKLRMRNLFRTFFFFLFEKLLVLTLHYPTYSRLYVYRIYVYWVDVCEFEQSLV